MERHRAAANSIANGMPSSRSHIEATVVRSSSVNSSASSAALARSRNSSIPSDDVSDATATTRSPGTPNGSRLVANTVESGQPATMAAQRSATGATTCSQLSMIKSTRRPRSQSTIESTIDTPN